MAKNDRNPPAEPEGEGEGLPPILDPSTASAPPEAPKPTPTGDPTDPILVAECAKIRGLVDKLDAKGRLARAHPSEHKGWIHACAMQRLRVARNGLSVPAEHDKLTLAQYDALVAEAMGVTIGGQPAKAGV